MFCRLQCGYDLGDKMGRRDEIDVVRTLFLQFQKDAGQAGQGNFPASPALRDFVVLAVYAAQIAAAEKNSAGTVRAGQTWLFPEMEGRSRGCKPCVLPAVTDFADVSVDVTFPWTERTV